MSYMYGPNFSNKLTLLNLQRKRKFIKPQVSTKAQFLMMTLSVWCDISEIFCEKLSHFQVLSVKTAVKHSTIWKKINVALKKVEIHIEDEDRI